MSTNPFLDNPFLPSATGSAARRASSLPPLSEEQQASILDEVLGGALTGLGWVGESLDKAFGGRTVRGLIGAMVGTEDAPGVGESLAHLIPFSDSLGLTDQGMLGANLLADKHDVPTGEQLNKHAGIDFDNPWLDIPAGVATEIVTDPATALLGGSKAIVGGVNKALGAGEKATTLAGKMTKAKKAHAVLHPSPSLKIKQILGEDKIYGVKRGAFAIRNPFGDPIVFGHGSKLAAGTSKLLSKNPVTRGVRQYFDHRMSSKGGKGVFESADQEIADFMTDMDAALLARSNAGVEHLAGQLDEISDIQTSTIKAELALPENKGVLDQLLGKTRAGDLDKLDKHALARALAELGHDPENVGILNKLLAKSTARSEDLASGIKAYDQHVSDALKFKDDFAEQFRKAGGSLAELDDEFTEHFARRLTDSLREVMKKDKAKSSAQGVWGAIQRSIRDIKGGTWKVNQVAVDARITGRAGVSLAEKLVILKDEYGIDKFSKTADDLLHDASPKTAGRGDFEGLEVPTVRTRHMDDVLEQLGHTPAEIKAMTPIKAWGHLTKDPTAVFEIDPRDSLIKAMGGMPEKVLKEGLFTRSMTDDVMDYTRNIASKVAGAKASRDMLEKHIVEEGTVKASDVLKKLGLKSTGDFKLDGMVDREVADIAENFYKLTTKPDNTRSLMAKYDKFLGFMKASTYSVWPASHVRDATSGFIQNMLTAPLKHLGGALNDAQNAIRGKGGKYANEFNLRYESDYATEIFGKGVRTDDTPLVRDLFSKDTYDGIGSLNPLRAFKAGDREADQFFMMSAGAKAAELSNYSNKFTSYAAHRRAGWDQAAAFRKANEVHYDYAALSDFERKTMKRIFPFYTFARMNLVGQVRQLAGAPGGRTRQLIRGINDSQRAADKEGGYVPQYLRKGLVIPTSKNAAGEQNFFASHGLAMVEEAFNRFSFTGGVPDLPKTMMNIGAMTSPPLQGLLQHTFNKQMWTGRDLHSLHQSFPDTGNPNLNMWMRQVPGVGRGLHSASQIEQAHSGRKTTPQALINLLVGGVKNTTVDMPKWQAIDARNGLEEILKGAGGVGQYSRLYPRDADKLSEKQLQQLQMLNVILGQQRAKRKSQ